MGLPFEHTQQAGGSNYVKMAIKKERKRRRKKKPSRPRYWQIRNYFIH